jgi:hypothetical protein
MGQRVTSEQLRDILSVARKLRISARGEENADYLDLFLRAAEALEARAQQLAFHPYDPRPLELEDQQMRAALHRPVDILC